jgi:hypothetical protein
MLRYKHSPRIRGGIEVKDTSPTLADDEHQHSDNATKENADDIQVFASLAIFSALGAH